MGEYESDANSQQDRLWQSVAAAQPDLHRMLDPKLEDGSLIVARIYQLRDRPPCRRGACGGGGCLVVVNPRHSEVQHQTDYAGLGMMGGIVSE
jgi:hypothetical protein